MLTATSSQKGCFAIAKLLAWQGGAASFDPEQVAGVAPARGKKGGKSPRKKKSKKKEQPGAGVRSSRADRGVVTAVADNTAQATKPTPKKTLVPPPSPIRLKPCPLDAGLTELDLAWNGIHGRGALGILGALRANAKLRVLDLSCVLNLPW